MSTTQKILALIFSTIFVVAFTFVLCWGIINFNKVKDGISTTGVYTEVDVNNAYDDGYNTAIMDKEEYELLINSYRDTITSQTDQIAQLNSKVNTLTNDNKDKSTQIVNLTSQRDNLQLQVNNLEDVKNQNESTISDLNNQIDSLKLEITNLTNSGVNKDSEIESLNNQIKSLQSLVSQLETTNELNLNTITNLNNQINILNSQISDLTLQIQSNSNTVSSLNNRISDLEKSVEYYEQYIATLENENQVVATFEFDNSVYVIQILNKNDCASVTTPQSTDYVVFNYWMVDGIEVDLSSYPISTNTRFVANVTYNYDVKYIVDDSEYNSQIITNGSYSAVPENPTKDGYEFDGWSIDGINVIDPTNIEITDNTTFTAVFTKLHSVTFLYEDTTLSSQTIRNGNYATNISVDDTTYKVFNGWLLNGVSVNPDNQKIVADTIFVADITYYYEVKFINGDSIHNTQIVINNGFVSLPSDPSKEYAVFDGWSLNGSDIIDPTVITITSDMQFYAIFTDYVISSKFINATTTNTSTYKTDTFKVNLINVGSYYDVNNIVSYRIKLFDYSVYGYTNSLNTYYTKTIELNFESDVVNKDEVITVNHHYLDDENNEIRIIMEFSFASNGKFVCNVTYPQGYYQYYRLNEIGDIYLYFDYMSEA